MLAKRNTQKMLLISLVLFFIYLPLFLRIKFMQNDDWYYYEQVQVFLNGNFTLLNEMAPTFYLQGFAGGIFAKLFGIKNLSFLTLIVSLINLNIFHAILKKTTKLSASNLLIVSLIFFLNPLNQYTIFGFMTEQYFLLFVLLSIYFWLIKKDGPSAFAALLGFLVRQLSIFLPLSAGISLVAHKKFKKGLWWIALAGGIFLAYTFLFPQTLEMHEKTLQFHHIKKFNYTFTVFYGSFLYFVAFSIPIILSISYKFQKKKLLLLAVIGVVTYFGFQYTFKPMAISWGEFPYFENTWERTGFMPREIHGTKYQFKGIFDLYHYWELAAKILAAALLGLWVLRKDLFKKLFEFETVLLMTYLVTVTLAHTFYDRYLVIAVPIFMLCIFQTFEVREKVLKIAGTGFVLFLSFYAYTFATDFVLVENYVWQQAQQLVTNENILPNDIYANTAWNEKHHSHLDQALYLFSYDSPELLSKEIQYIDVENFEINYPGNLHVNSNLYLYSLIGSDVK